MNLQAFAVCTVLFLLFGHAELAAQIVLEASFPGDPPSLVPSTSNHRYDFNDDGLPDLPFIDLTDGFAITIQDGADPGQQSYILPEVEDDVVLGLSQARVIGYFELDQTNGQKEILLAEKQGRRFVNPIIVDADGNVLWDGTSNTVLLTIADVDGDASCEVVVYNPQVPQVEVWGEDKG
ncbi:MAG: hypothetical protein GVY18_13115 [Bacteroidetes bacterium]|jgi:hypothetical protein|nr:hypothetical protein [Bacteroidota bacterium]